MKGSNAFSAVVALMAGAAYADMRGIEVLPVEIWCGVGNNFGRNGPLRVEGPTIK